MNDTKQNAARDLLARSIKDSGLTITEFATRLLSRPYTTVWRWLRGESPISQSVIDWLTHWASLSEHSRRRIIGALNNRAA